jgi:hypothetical protein
MIHRSRLIWLLPLLSLSACNNQSEEQAAPKAISKAKQSAVPIAQTTGPILGTPMAERVAVLGFLNKRNGQARDIELKPGQDIRIGKVVIRLRACERTAPWENFPDQGAFVQFLVFERPPETTDPERWRRRFSGWLFKENPAANIIQHPIYDIWVKECKMSFPGEEDKAEEGAPVAEVAAAAPRPVAKKPSSADQSAAPPARAERTREPEPVDEPEEPVTEETTIEE